MSAARQSSDVTLTPPVLRGSRPSFFFTHQEIKHGLAAIKLQESRRKGQGDLPVPPVSIPALFRSVKESHK
ncbi:hypothetical protein M378DRAFT_165073 [Amanita muscaria Koide BX008]|uniref:Uncharacterized protein n=1 Tax=Amanita muscaria (strain Koide BX008) TaxID=946122 RepID=A0A0C2X1G3_AMAMK|nr:hypothetical protein M378DRAFT_165073 [Amanita muscaria Koide BX008]